MKLDEGIQDQKLALDITPLIDIVFLLVLFFAVSTSFISGEDLDVLKTTLVTLTTDKQDLAEEIAQQTQEIAEKTQTIGTLQGDLEKARGDTEELRTVVASLEQQSLRLKATLDDTTTERKSLEQQLKDSLQDFESLNVQLESVKTEKQRQEEKDQLLRSLLLERAQENEQLQQRAATFESQVSSAAENNAALASKLSSAAESNAALAAQLESTKDEQTKQIEKERLLQALLAEKAAKYEDQEVLLVNGRGARGEPGIADDRSCRGEYGPRGRQGEPRGAERGAGAASRRAGDDDIAHQGRSGQVPGGGEARQGASGTDHPGAATARGRPGSPVAGEQGRHQA